MTFACPHLGFFSSTMTPFGVGYRFYRRFLKQETFLYRLSKYKGLEFFQNIVLIGSAQDEYGDLAGSRAEASLLPEDLPNKDVYESMLNNIWAPVQPERVMRLKINFHFAEKSFDN